MGEVRRRRLSPAVAQLAEAMQERVRQGWFLTLARDLPHGWRLQAALQSRMHIAVQCFQQATQLRSAHAQVMLLEAAADLALAAALAVVQGRYQHEAASRSDELFAEPPRKIEWSARWPLHQAGSAGTAREGVVFRRDPEERRAMLERIAQMGPDIPMGLVANALLGPGWACAGQDGVVSSGEGGQDHPGDDGGAQGDGDDELCGGAHGETPAEADLPVYGPEGANTAVRQGVAEQMGGVAPGEPQAEVLDLAGGEGA
jgi:hypothetical protein